MYEIRPETVKTFVLDRNIKLPRFQRKLTWDEKKNFQLCISLFKEYPMGVTILSVEEKDGKTVRWLLDGRQRKNALLQMYEDPENIYNWAKKFIGFKNNNQPSEIDEMFWNKINEYIEYSDEEDEDDHYAEIEIDDDTTDAVESSETEYLKGKNGLEFLLEIIKIIHNKSPNNTGFTKPFDICKYVSKLPYIENNQGSNKLSSKKLKTFLDEYRNYCSVESCDYENVQSFYDYIDSRCQIEDKAKLLQHLTSKWDDILLRINLIERIDNLLSNSKIGLIEVKNLAPADSQKIFNIINSKGEALTAVEVLSAKPSWNTKIKNVAADMQTAVDELYRKIGTSNYDVVKWDLPATLLKRIGSNFIIKDFKDEPKDFAKEITYGFKIVAGIWKLGVKKENIEALSVANINWANEYESLVSDLKNMLRLISSFTYFKFFNTWQTTIMDLTSDSIALNFLILSYFDWKRKGKPLGNDTKAKIFGKNCLIIWDKLIYEYVSSQWRGSGDTKIATNISSINSEEDLFVPISTEKWLQLFESIEGQGKIFENKLTVKLMKPILYHFYCLKSIEGPGSMYQLEVDHIIPQSLFESSALIEKDSIVNSIFNLGVLPKNENISKGKKTLIEIRDPWLRSQIEKYEFVSPKEFDFYSNINNYSTIYEQRIELFKTAFDKNRSDLINN